MHTIIVIDKSYLTIISSIFTLNLERFKDVVIAITQTASLAVLLCFYTIFVFSIHPSFDEFAGMSLEVTDQNQEGVFSSLSRNFEQTIEEINTGDKEGDSSSNADEKSTSSDVPIATSESANLISSNSTTNDGLEKKNQTDFSNQN